MEITKENAVVLWLSRGLSPDALDDLWRLAKGVRKGDAVTEEFSGRHGEGVTKLLTDLGWHPEAVKYMAEQRTIRAIVARRDGIDALKRLTSTNTAKMVQGFDPAIQTLIMSVWMDGFAAHALGEREDDS